MGVEVEPPMLYCRDVQDAITNRDPEKSEREVLRDVMWMLAGQRSSFMSRAMTVAV